MGLSQHLFCPSAQYPGNSGMFGSMLCPWQDPAGSSLLPLLAGRLPASAVILAENVFDGLLEHKRRRAKTTQTSTP